MGASAPSILGTPIPIAEFAATNVDCDQGTEKSSDIHEGNVMRLSRGLLGGLAHLFVVLCYASDLRAATQDNAKDKNKDRLVQVVVAPSSEGSQPQKSDDHAIEYYKLLAESQAKVAETAIKSSEAAVEHVKDLVTLFSVVAAAFGAILTFLGLREISAWNKLSERARNACEKAEKDLEELEKRRNEALALQELQIDFLTARATFDAYYGGDDLKKKQLASEVRSQLEHLRKESADNEKVERIYSWASASLAMLYSDSKDYTLALKLAEEAQKKNPRGFADRSYNLACFASLAWRESRSPEMLETCIRWLKLAIAEDPTTVAEVAKDKDFDETRDEPPVKKVLGNQ